MVIPLRLRWVWVYACLGVTCHLHFWQNDRGPSRATAITRGLNGHRIRVSTQSSLCRRKFSRRFCRNSNSQPLDHESGALTNKLSRQQYEACAWKYLQIFYFFGPTYVVAWRLLRAIATHCNTPTGRRGDYVAR